MAEAFQNEIYGSPPPAAATGIQIRDATEADLPAIVEIHNAAIASRISTAQLEPVTIESQGEWFRAHSPAQYPILVAEVEGVIAGWLSFKEFLPRCAYRGCRRAQPLHQRTIPAPWPGQKIVAGSDRARPTIGDTLARWINFWPQRAERRPFPSRRLRALGSASRHRPR